MIYDRIRYDMIRYDMIRYDMRDAIRYVMIYGMIWYIFNCSWLDTRWQNYSTHLRTNIT